MQDKQYGESLILKVYDLIKFMIPNIERIPRTHKFTYGDRLYNLLSDLLEIIIEIHYASKQTRKEKLHEANILLTKIRYFLRMGYDLGFYSAGHLKIMAERVDEIGRRIGGWIKSTS
ncbi:MAG: diversity-generating retroelement protein Avd [Bacteroidota bacterium]